MARIKLALNEEEITSTAAKVVKEAEKTSQEPKRPKQTSASPKLRIRTDWMIFGVIVVSLLVAIANLSHDRAAVMKELKQIRSNPQQLIDEQNAQLVKKVSLLTTLPADETPIVATVSDAAQVKTQSSFFADAQNGDRVLQYNKANKLVLYRPSTNQVISVGLLNVKP